MKKIMVLILGFLISVLMASSVFAGSLECHPTGDCSDGNYATLKCDQCFDTYTSPTPCYLLRPGGTEYTSCPTWSNPPNEQTCIDAGYTETNQVACGEGTTCPPLTTRTYLGSVTPSDSCYHSYSGFRDVVCCYKLEGAEGPCGPTGQTGPCAIPEFSSPLAVIGLFVIGGAVWLIRKKKK